MDLDDNFKRLVKELGQAINESLSDSERIAEVMGRSEAAVKSLLARARTNLREQLEPYLRTGQRSPSQ